MAIDPDFLDLLACPECRVSVVPTVSGDGLRCSRCHRVYPIEGGIPRMLPDKEHRKPPARGAP